MQCESQHLSLRDIVNRIADDVCKRAVAGKNFGIVSNCDGHHVTGLRTHTFPFPLQVLIPDGLLRSIPEIRALITELDAIASASSRLDHISQLLVTSFYLQRFLDGMLTSP